MKHTIQKKRYNTLRELRDEIVNDNIEQVIEFNGWHLVTRRGKTTIEYGLYQGVIRITENNVSTYHSPL